MISQNLDDFEFRALWTVNKSSQFYEKTTKENKMSTCKLWKIRFKMLRGECDCCLDDCCEENTNLVTSDDFIDSLVSIWTDFVPKLREIMSKHFRRQKFIDFTKVFKSFLVFVTFCTLYTLSNRLCNIVLPTHTKVCKSGPNFYGHEVKSFFPSMSVVITYK